MKKKIFIALGIYSLIFFLGGVYIISAIENSTAKLNHLIKLHQVETLRERLLIRVKDVQSDLNLRRTLRSKSIDTIISNVRSLEKMAASCFECHHSEYVVKRLHDLKNGIEKYKALVSRTLTVRANRERLEQEDENAFVSAEQLSEKINEMVHMATSKLYKKTQSSLNDIANTKMILYVLVGITPFFAAGLVLIFIRGITKPVNILLKATRKLKGGDLGFRIKGVKDEFGEVAASFNQMAGRMGDYTQKLEAQTLELERAHHEMSTFCQVLKQIGTQGTLDGVGSFLMKELQTILSNQYMLLYVFSSDRSVLFTLSRRGTATVEDPELIRSASTILDGLDGLTIAPKESIKPPLIPDDFPAKGRQSIIPLRTHNQLEGAFVVACDPGCQCDEKALELIALVLGQVSGTIKRAVLHEEEVRHIRNRIDSTAEFSGIIGKDPKMQIIYKLIEDAAPTDASVLIQGESGTGKELVARAIHQMSLRKGKPFIVINCSAYPSTLLESEIFGHEKGAFTGALRRKSGRFEQAHGGTILLDEIGEIPPAAQVKLLRVIQTQKFERVGGEQTLEVDVRILSATNKDLLKEVKLGHFREDLFYRLNVIPVQLPPLRSRRNDIPLLAGHFLSRFAAVQQKSIQGFSSEAVRLLLDYPWPGNVRELENSLEHAVVLAKGDRVEISDLPTSLLQNRSAPPATDRSYSNGISIMENEARLLKDVLDECGWNKKEAARRLGISRSTLYGKLKKYQISPTIH